MMLRILLCLIHRKQPGSADRPLQQRIGIGARLGLEDAPLFVGRGLRLELREDVLELALARLLGVVRAVGGRARDFQRGECGAR